MAQLKGKQFKNNTISQNNFNISTDSISKDYHVINKQYIINRFNESVGGLHQSKLNLNMTANNATIGQKATNDYIIEFPVSNVMVKINNVYVNVGETKDCYFSPDGITIREGGNAEKGDYLYWNSNKYDLENDDEIDFLFLVNYNHYTLSANTSKEINPYYDNIVIKYVGDEGTYMTVTMEDVDFLVGNSGGSFVWDVGGLNEYVFTSEKEYITQDVNNETYKIWFDGFGSLIFSIKKESNDSIEIGELNILYIEHDNTPYPKGARTLPIIYNNHLYYTCLGYEGLYSYNGDGTFSRLFNTEVDTYEYLIYDNKLFLGSDDNIGYYDGQQYVTEMSYTVSAGVTAWFYSSYYDSIFVTGSGPAKMYRRDKFGKYNFISNNRTWTFLEVPNNKSKIIFIDMDNKYYIYRYENGNIIQGAYLGYEGRTMSYYNGYLYIGDRNNQIVRRYDSYNLENETIILDNGDGEINQIQSVYGYLFIITTSDIYKYDGNQIEHVSNYNYGFPGGNLTPFNGEIYIPAETNSIYKIK